MEDNHKVSSAKLPPGVTAADLPNGNGHSGQFRIKRLTCNIEPAFYDLANAVSADRKMSLSEYLRFLIVQDGIKREAITWKDCVKAIVGDGVDE